jgi:phosphatidylglycerol---prolipoprotein diacylglyceryl transferase
MAHIGTAHDVLDVEHGTCSAGGSLHYYSRGSEPWSICLRARVKGCTFRLTAPVRFPLVALLSIPSPGDPFLVNSGPIHARWYGLLLALGVLLAGWIARREFRRRSMDPELAYTIAVWAVPLGLIGARLYHVLTDWDSFSSNYSQIPAIWNGGLSIFGAVLGGMLGCWIGCRRTKLPFWRVADCIAPGLILAQALGRWGNYFNQELYGKPTNLPWAVKIDPAHRTPPYTDSSTFQPMFLYESILDVLVFLVLIWFTRRYWRRVPYGTVFALYVTLYNFYRVPLETLKIDTADIFFGQRVNVWVSGVLFLAGLIAFILLFRRRTAAPAPTTPAVAAAAASGHTPTPRPEAAIAARQRTQRRKKT